jgi:DNA primase
LGVDPAARICFNYESGLKFRYDDLDTGERIIRWRFGKPTLWRLGTLAQARKVYLTEGESDAISLINEGVENEPGVSVLAVPCSTFRLAPLAPLFKGKEVVLVPDPDEAGLKAGERWVNALEPYAAHLSYLGFISKEASPHG